MRACLACGESLHISNVTGICQRTLECRAAYKRARAALERTAARERREAVRRAAAEAETAIPLAEREKQLAERAGSDCPACGGTIGRNGGCYQSQNCIDVTLRLLIPGWNPAQLLRQ